jgi:hypothetical protein
MQNKSISLLSLALICCWGLAGAFTERPLQAQAAVPPTPEAPKLDLVFEEVVTLDQAVPAGETPWGRRNMIPITGGTFNGPKLKGKILPGGWDWQLITAKGCVSLQADYMIQTDDGVLINVLNKGKACASSGGALFTTPVFEAPVGKYDWLNGGAYVGTLAVSGQDGKPAVRIRFYKVY